MRRLTTVTAAVAALLLAGCAATTTTSGGGGGNTERLSPAPAVAPHCGIERWAVKTGTDPAAAQVDTHHLTPMSVAALAAQPVPAGIDADPAHRFAPVETTVYQVHATLVKYKMEADSDYHLVLSGGGGHSMIAEIPAPACVGASPFAAAITAARAQFDARFAPGDFWQPAGVPVIITGVGFFDRIHGQTGVARNGIELHPVLSVSFGSPATAPPTATGSAVAVAAATGLAGCFGHAGVQYQSANAFECVFKDADEGGTLYWQRNNSDYAWDLHPDAGNLVINAATTRISPENAYYGLWVAVASSEGGCTVQGAGYGQHPTMCANPGKPPKTMSARQQASYDDWAEVMGEAVPDCAWEPAGTPAAATC